MVRREFPEVRLIAGTSNVGFARANRVAPARRDRLRELAP